MENVKEGSILNIFKLNDTTTPLYVQAHQTKSMGNKVRLMINDGKFFMNAVYTPKNASSAQAIPRFSVIYCENYTISFASNKYFLVLDDVTIVAQLNDFVKEGTNSNNLIYMEKYLKEYPQDNEYMRLNTNGIPNANEGKTLDNAANGSNGVGNNMKTENPTKVMNSNNNNNGYSHQSTSSGAGSGLAGAATVPPAFQGLTTIDQLSPYHRTWSIKARVSYKGDLRNWKNQRGEGKLFSVHFLDETGEIKVSAFNKVAEKFYDLLQENKVYYLTKGTIQNAKKQFSNLKNDYEINLEKDSIIEPANDDDGSVPQISYNFVELDKVQNLENNQVIDVLGVIKSVDEKREIVSKSTGKSFDRRDVIIVDDSKFSVTVSLWNQLARDFNLNIGTPVAIKGCKVNDFNGKQLSLIPTAQVTPNPEIPQAYKLKGWFDSEGAQSSFKSTSNTLSSNNDLNSKKSLSERITIKEANEQNLGLNGKDDYFTIKCSVSFIKPDRFAYPSCSSEGCMKKVIQENDGTWRCEKCSINHPEPLYRYMLTLSAIDSTGQMWLSLFNDRAEKLIGCSANDLMKLKDENDDGTNLKNYFTNNILFNEYNFRIRARLDTYQGVDRARYEVVSIAPVDASAECDVLIDSIEKFNI